MNSLMIDYFMAVATNLSFTKTSEELFVSQPAISKQIAQLEKELGAKLLIRNNKRTELTEVGRLYYDLFSRYKADFMSVRIEADRIMEKKKVIIRLGILEGWDLADVMPAMIKEFKDKYPDAEISLSCCGVKELSNALMKNSLDIAVTLKNSISMLTELKCTDLTDIKKILIYSTQHKLSNKDSGSISLSDFRSDSFIAPWSTMDNMIIEAVSSYTRPYGFVPDLSFVNNHESMVSSVRNNLGVAIVDEWVWAKDADDLKWIPFDSYDTVSLARLKSNQSEHVMEMEKIILDTVGKK